MKTLKQTNIIDDIIRQGKVLFDGGKLKVADLDCDKLFMLCDNDSWNDDFYARTYYCFENEIHDRLESWALARGNV